MASKLKNLSSEERNEVEAQIDLTGDKINEIRGDTRKDYSHLYGICGNCLSFVCVETEFTILMAGCSNYNICGECNGAIRLDSKHPVMKCTEHSRRGEMSIYEMKQIATLINPAKDRVGFSIGDREDENS